MVPEAHRLHGCFRVSWPVVGEGMERKHSAAIETVLERHKCPGLSSNLGGMGRALADRSDRPQALSRGCYRTVSGLATAGIF